MHACMQLMTVCVHMIDVSLDMQILRHWISNTQSLVGRVIILPAEASALKDPLMTTIWNPSDHYDHLIIETSSPSLPGTIVRAFADAQARNDPVLQLARLDTLVQ